MDNGRIMLRNLKEALEKMAFDVKRTLQYIMESNVGINDKVDKNTLRTPFFARSCFQAIRRSMKFIHMGSIKIKTTKL